MQLSTSNDISYLNKGIDSILWWQARKSDCWSETFEFANLIIQLEAHKYSKNPFIIDKNLLILTKDNYIAVGI